MEFIYSPDSLAWPAEIYTIWPFLTSPMSSPILCHPHWFTFCSLSIQNEFSATHTTHTPSPDLLKIVFPPSLFSRVSGKQSLISHLCCMADPFTVSLLWIHILFILRSRHKKQTQPGMCQTHDKGKRRSELIQSNTSSQSFSVELGHFCLRSHFIGQGASYGQA